MAATLLYSRNGQITKNCRDESGAKHFKRLFDDFDNVDWKGRRKYYAYNVSSCRQEFIDGTPKKFRNGMFYFIQSAVILV